MDRGNWQFRAERPNQLWVSDFTSVSIWQGWLYVASVVDVYARRIVGWRVSKSMTTAFVLDALEQALYARQPGNDGSLTHHSDRGSQYVSIRYSECLAEAGIEPSVGRRGDNYDNALAETISGLCKAELIHRRQPQWGIAIETASHRRHCHHHTAHVLLVGNGLREFLKDNALTSVLSASALVSHEWRWRRRPS